ncbi:hypothetical protein [Mesorhizobium sp.]|uniref:hypothetical protein n=1 Tax=Mesorhizobium sp. TaxID=1871066 RepID=UPI0025BED36E|nr:hypothetical protein [Mesorhizobium sp.]
MAGALVNVLAHRAWHGLELQLLALALQAVDITLREALGVRWQFQPFGQAWVFDQG